MCGMANCRAVAAGRTSVRRIVDDGRDPVPASRGVPVREGAMFAGIGATCCALGQGPVWYSEIEPFPNAVMAHHYPDSRAIGDCTQVDPSTLDPVDIITAGFPCQDLSVAGKRKGLEGERSKLFWEIVRYAKRLRPRWLLLENVLGLLSSHGGADFETVLSALDELGYGLAWTVLDAQYTGVAQRRRRVFVVGYLGAPCPPEILFEPEGVCGDSAPRRETGQDVAGTLGGGSQSGGFRTTDLDNNGGFVVSGPLGASLDRHTEIDGSGAFPVVPDPSGVAHPRRLTPLEAERLQGFPDGWTAIPGASDSKRYRALGNSMAVPCVGWILARIRAYRWSP